MRGHAHAAILESAVAARNAQFVCWLLGAPCCREVALPTRKLPRMTGATRFVCHNAARASISAYSIYHLLRAACARAGTTTPAASQVKDTDEGDSMCAVELHAG